jgi:hypothetical protein
MGGIGRVFRLKRKPNDFFVVPLGLLLRRATSPKGSAHFWNVWNTLAPEHFDFFIYTLRVRFTVPPCPLWVGSGKAQR